MREIDAIVGDLIDFFGKRGVQVVLLSEYGITNVDTPIHLNRIFREHGWLTVKDELGLEILDAGASKVFAVADHQVAHIYLNDASLEKSVRDVLEKTAGVEKVLGKAEKIAAGIDHPRAGDLIAVAQENAWFTYYYWLDDARAPDFARTVDIHRKPGYDPVELFLDPKIPAAEIENRVAAAAKKTRLPDVDGRDSARRDAGERLARPATGGQKRLAGVHHRRSRKFWARRRLNQRMFFKFCCGRFWDENFNHRGAKTQRNCFKHIRLNPRTDGSRHEYFRQGRSIFLCASASLR